MAKNASAANARDGGKAQETAVPSNGNSSTPGTTTPGGSQQVLGNSDDSSAASNTDVAAGTGENFDKMLADKFQSTHGLKVTSSQDGFRRAGRAWSTTPTVIALSEFSRADLAALEAESTLSIRLVRLDDEEA
jgi:hypothetical protein